MTERDRDPLARLYDVADDYETGVLDALRAKAGMTWECACEPGGWTNPEDVSECERCGTPRKTCHCGEAWADERGHAHNQEREIAALRAEFSAAPQ